MKRYIAVNKVIDGENVATMEVTDRKGYYLADEVDQRINPDCGVEGITDHDDGLWTFKCGYSFYLADGSPDDNGINYCPSCGGKLNKGE